jgi:uncharacterized protein YtpQ (UPF0354 family)
MSGLPREPEAFGEQVLLILKRNWPERSAELVGALDMVVDGRHLGLQNLYRMVLGDLTRGVEIVEDYLEKLLEGDDIAVSDVPFDVAKPRIMPRIQPMTVFDYLDRDQVAYSEFVNGTVLVYVLDLPQLTVSLTVEQMVRWGTDSIEIEEIAKSNLEQYAPELKIQVIESQDGGRAALLNEQDGYDAARLLLGKLHERLAPELHGDFYVATPARDMFVALSCDPEPFVERLQKRVDQDYRRLPYPITRDMFVVTQDGVAGTAA